MDNPLVRSAGESAPESKTFNEQVVNTVQALILGLDPQANVTFFNQRCEQVTGWTRQEALGKNWFEHFVPERLRPPVETVFRDLIESVEENEYENPILTRSGEERVVAWRNIVQRDASGQFFMVLATGIDVTERRQAEETLHALNAVALTIQQTLEPQQIFEIAARELGNLGFDCTGLLSDEGGDYLKVVFTNFSSRTIAAAEKLTGLTAIGYRIPIERVDVFKTAFREQQAILVHESAQVIEQALPKRLAKFARRVTRLVGLSRFIVAPMIAGDKLLGVLAVHSPALGAPHVPAVTAFANQVAIAIENARLFQAEREQRELSETLRQVTNALNASLDQEQVLQLILEQLARVVDYASASVMLVSGDALVTVVQQGFRSERQRLDAMQIKDLPHVREVLEHHRPLIIADTHADARWYRRSDSQYIRCWLGVPLVVQDQTIGLLNLDREQPGSFTAHYANVAVTFANHAANAIANARLFKETQAALTKSEALYRTSRSLIAVKSLPDTLQTVVDAIAEALPANRVVIWTLNLQERRVIHCVQGGADPTPFVPISFGELWNGLCGWVLREHKPALSPKGTLDPRENRSTQERRTALGVGAVIAVPLYYRDKTLGTMVATNQLDQRDFTSQDVELLMAMASQVVIAIENTQLYETQRQQADELARLHRASDTLFFSATADLSTLAQNIVQAVLKEFGQANCSLLLLNPITDELERIGVAGPYISQVIRGRLSLNGPGLVPRAVRTGQIVNVPDVSAASDYVANWDLARSEMTVPLRVGDRIIGALDVQSSQLAAFGPIDERLLDAFAERAALALENARLYQESQQRQAEATALYKATQPIESLDLPSVLKALAERASALTDLPHCVISLLEPERTTARIVTAWGFPEEQAQTLLNRLFSASDHPASWQKVFVKQRPFVVPDTTDTPFQEQGDGTNQPPRSVLITPLMVSDRLIGSLQLTGQARALPDDLVHRVETFATQAAITIENARLYKAVQEYARWLQIASWEREQLLEKVQQHAATLEQQVAARTAEIFAEKEKIEAILKSAGDAIVITDPEGRISYVNIAFTALTGYTIQEMAHYAIITELFNDQTPPATFAGLKRSVAQGARWRGDVNVRHRDGHAIEANMTLAPVRDENDRLINLVGSLRDVSQTRALERAKSEFLTNVSHQLRTPVTNLKTFAFLLSKRAPQDRARYVQTILDEAEKLSHLVQDLLQIAELDAGPIIADWKPFSPLEIVTSTFTRHLSQAEAAGLSLSTQVPSEHLPPVLGSKYRLAQALNQIVENALAFTTQGEVVIGIRLDTSDESETPEMVLWVSDTGPGISPEEQNHIFERFFRGQVAQPGHIPGTGLGLAMARMIVEAHGGRIVVQSTVGQGSTFEIRLPVLG